MTGLTLDSEEFDYLRVFGIRRSWLDTFFPHFLLITDGVEIVDQGRLWKKTSVLSNSKDDFSIKGSIDPFNTDYLKKESEKSLSMVHFKTGISFKGEFFISDDGNYFLVIIRPKITSTESIDRLKISIGDLPSYDSTFDYALLFQTQKNLLKENSDLILKLMVERSKLKDMNANLEVLVENRTQQLELSRAQNIQASKLASLGEMAGGIAHEINNPLTTISLAVQSIKKMRMRGKLTDEKLYSLLDQIENTVVRVAKLVTNLKSLSRGRPSIHFLHVSLTQTLQEVLSLFSERFKNNGISFEIRNSTNENKVLFMGDQVQLSQVLVNLLENSYDAIEDLHERWIRIEMMEDDRYWKLSVIDSGKGVPEKIRDKIFVPFFTTKEIGKGTGLGLSISKKLISDFGGTLEMDPSNQNTCFLIKLPKIS